MDGLKAGQGKAFHSHYAKMDELNKDLTFAAERYCSIDLEEIDSIWSKESPEGMVYRVERKGKVDFLAKWVRQDFEAGKYCIGIDEKDLIWNVALNCG